MVGVFLSLSSRRIPVFVIFLILVGGVFFEF